MNRALADRRPYLSNFLANPATKQLIRYAIAGFCVTQLAAGIYSTLILALLMRPLEANVASTACGLAIGYAVHSRWSFAGASADAEHAKIARFLLSSLLAFLANSAWVFLLVSVMRLPPLAPVPLMMFATPWLSFLLNRHWVFRAA